MAFNCIKCGKESKNGTGKAAHERKCKVEVGAPPDMSDEVVPEPAVEVPPPPRANPVRVEAGVVVRQLRGLTLTYDGTYHLIDPQGRTIGHYNDETLAILGIEGMARHAKNFH
jgi:hypothetical protein